MDPATATWNAPLPSRRGTGKGGPTKAKGLRTGCWRLTTRKIHRIHWSQNWYLPFPATGELKKIVTWWTRRIMSILPRTSRMYSRCSHCLCGREKDRVGIYVILWDSEEFFGSNGGRGLLGHLIAENHVGRHWKACCEAFNVTLLLHYSSTPVPACSCVVSTYLNYVFGLASDIVRCRSKD